MEALKISLKLLNAELNGLRLRLNYNSNDADIINKYKNTYELKNHIEDYLERYYNFKNKDIYK